jgi:hypothetical protein
VNALECDGRGCCTEAAYALGRGKGSVGSLDLLGRPLSGALLLADCRPHQHVVGGDVSGVLLLTSGGSSAWSRSKMAVVVMGFILVAPSMIAHVTRLCVSRESMAPV